MLSSIQVILKKCWKNVITVFSFICCLSVKLNVIVYCPFLYNGSFNQNLLVQWMKMFKTHRKAFSNLAFAGRPQ